MSRKVMGYIWVRTDKQDMGKHRYLLLEHAREQQLRIPEFGVYLDNVRKAVNPDLERPISCNSYRYFVQHDPALTATRQPHSGLNLFEGMCKNPQIELCQPVLSGVLSTMDSLSLSLSLCLNLAKEYICCWAISGNQLSMSCSCE